MITSLGLIGKAIEVLVTSVSKKKIDLAMDDKKKAAKSFVRLHESLLNLEIISDAFLLYIQGLKEGRNSMLYSVHLERVIGNLRPASLEFVNALAEISPVLGFYDRDLQRVLGQVPVTKRGLLKNFFYIAQSAVVDDINSPDPAGEVQRQDALLRFQRTLVERSFSTLRFTLPSDTLIDAELPPLREISLQGRREGLFDGGMFDLEFSDVDSELVTQHSEHGTATGALREPSRMRIDLFEVFKSNIENIEVGYLEVNKLIDLYPRLKRHHDLLAEVRESLRRFIEARFSLADVLYVTK